MKNTYSVLQGAPGFYRLQLSSSSKGAQSHYRRQLQEYSVIITDIENTEQGPQMESLREVCSLATSALVSMVHREGRQGKEAEALGNF